MVLCALGRFFNIFPLSVLANTWRTERIPLEMQMVMCFAGLRGAVSYALAMSLEPGEGQAGELDAPQGQRRVSDGLHHSTHLALAALADADLHLCLATAAAIVPGRAPPP